MALCLRAIPRKRNPRSQGRVGSIHDVYPLYLAFDPRGSSLPHWVRGWEAIDERLYVNGDVMGYFEIYRRRFPRGRVELDGNSARGSDWGDEGRSHYLVAVVPE